MYRGQSLHRRREARTVYPGVHRPDQRLLFENVSCVNSSCGMNIFILRDGYICLVRRINSSREMVLFISRGNSLYSKRTRIHPLTRINRCVEGEGQKYKPCLFMYNPSSSESIYDTKKRATEIQWLVFVGVAGFEPTTPCSQSRCAYAIIDIV